MRQPILLALVLASISQNQIAAPSLAAEEKSEWVLVQSSHFYGPQTLYISNDAVRIANGSTYGFEVLAKAPTWKRYCFKKAGKSFAVSDRFDLETALLGKFGSFKTSEPKIQALVVSQGSTNLQGIRCTKYLEPEHQAYTLTTNELNVDCKIGEVISEYYRVPYFKSVPLANWSLKKPSQAAKTSAKPPNLDKSKQKIPNWLDVDYKNYVTPTAIEYKFKTESCKKVKYNARDFAMPEGLREVKEISQVISSDQNKEIESLIDDIGFASERKREPMIVQPKRK
jgi:hypothetical protein